MKEHVPVKHDTHTPEDNRLTTLAHAESLKSTSLTAVRKASKDGTLLEHRRFRDLLLYRHRCTASNGDSKAARWLRRVIRSSKGALVVARAFVGEGWSHGSSDRVARETESVGTDSISELVSLTTFKQMLAEAINDGAVAQELREDGKHFLAIWEQQDARRARGEPVDDE
jgi:hypothetical protein